jgi:hypothetical protein
MKSKNHEGHVRQFRIASRAWYSPAVAAATGQEDGYECIQMGFYAPGGGSSGEFRIEWDRLGDKFTPRLKAYDDSWSALSRFQDVLAELAKLDDTDPTVEQITAVLLKCGVEDATERVHADDAERAAPETA